MLDLGSEHDPIDLQPHVLAYFARDDLIVTGKDLDENPGLGEISYSLRRAFLRGIKKSDIAEKRQIALVGDGIDCLLRRHLLVSDSDHPKAVGVEFRRLALAGV